MAITPDPWLTPWSRASAPVELYFPVAGVVLDVVHGLGDTPSGYLVVSQTGPVFASTVQLWTKERAFFMASAANTRARVIFLVVREDSVHAR